MVRGTSSELGSRLVQGTLPEIRAAVEPDVSGPLVEEQKWRVPLQ